MWPGRDRKGTEAPDRVATTVTEGMVVKTQAPAAKDAPQSVLEFLSSIIRSIAPSATRRRLRAAGFRVPGSAARHAVREFANGQIPSRTSAPTCCTSHRACARLAALHGGRRRKNPLLNVSERGDRASSAFIRGALDTPGPAMSSDLCPWARCSQGFPAQGACWELDKTASICTGCSRGATSRSIRRDEVVGVAAPRTHITATSAGSRPHALSVVESRDRSKPLVRTDGALHAPTGTKPLRGC